MSKKINRTEETGNDNPFKVPEGYFEGLTGQIMSQLPEKATESLKAPSLWERVQPWFYMAAMFAGIALMVNMFTRNSRYANFSGLNLSSSADIEEFYQYYEEQSTDNIYHDAIFFDEEYND